MQTPDNNHRQDDEALKAPPRLVAALRELPKERIFIPPTLDEAILHAAQRRLREREDSGFRWFRLVPWVAGAAAAILLLAVAWLSSDRPHRAVGERLAQEDLNHDGQVDILDAFALARQLKTGKTPGAQMDINGDGVVDERDVATLAAHAVRLEKGGRS